MNKPNVSGMIKSAKRTIAVHSPEILQGIGIAGMISTTILAVRATPKAVRLLEAKKKEESTDKLEAKDVIKTTWKCYIPATITGLVSVTCLVGASKVHLRRNAALTAAYKLSETALSEYRDKVIETVGEKKERLIRDKVDKERVEKNPVNDDDVIQTGVGKSLCLDYYSGRYFQSDIEYLRKAINKLNKSMIHDPFGYVSLNDFYDEINIPSTALGDVMGWNVSKGLIEEDFGSQLTHDGRPCIVVAFENGPMYDFESM